ncbi:MAG: sigma-70 family RNA polymerase sigma factor [Streptosporangiaceae bacterium]
MEDSEVVAAIVAGDPGGLAEAYDKYAVPLHAYCRSMLREPADAADAVQDTFVIASVKLGGLRDPGKLRAWLYAVARNICHRRLRAAEATSALDEAAEVPSETSDLGRAAERAELSGLVRAAMRGLNPADRDILELSMGQELDGGDLADILGVSRNHAHARLSRAREQMERSLAALLVARSGREACPALDDLLAGWDGQLTVLIRKRISRHIDGCEICGERKRRELTPALLAGAVPLVAVLPGFRDRVLAACADGTPEGVVRRAGVIGRAGPFGKSGFPKPAGPPGAPPPWHRAVPHARTFVAGAAAAVVAAGVITAVTLGGGSPHGHLAASGAGGMLGGPRPAATVAASPSPDPTGSPLRSGGGPASPVGSPGTTPTQGRPGTPGTPRATSPGSSSSASQAASPTSPTSARPSASASPSPSVAQGTLSIAPSRLVLAVVNGKPTGTITLTAVGGPVTGYTVTVGSAAVGKLTVSPASGSLASGASVAITVTASSLITLAATVTINPGGHAVTVVLALTT